MPSLRHNKRQSCLVNSLRTKIFLSPGSGCKNLFTLAYIVEVYGTKYGLGLSRNVWLEMLSEAFTSSTLVSSRNTIGCDIVPGLLLERWSWLLPSFTSQRVLFYFWVVAYPKQIIRLTCILHSMWLHKLFSLALHISNHYIHDFRWLWHSCESVKHVVLDFGDWHWLVKTSPKSIIHGVNCIKIASFLCITLCSCGLTRMIYLMRQK